MSQISKKDLVVWCKIPVSELENHPKLKVKFSISRDSVEMAQIMARMLVDEIKVHNTRGEPTRAIIPCGPLGWYKPFTELVNKEGVCLREFVVFHMDECLDWQGKALPKNHPFNFRTYMENNFYGPILPELNVPEENRNWLDATNIDEFQQKIASTTIDITYGGWGQDGHLAFNQARRNPYSQITIDELRNSTVRIQENNYDTILALSQRTLGTAYQFVPPMSVTIGVKEIMNSKKVRVFSGTGAWKQTALRIALFGPLTSEYPMTFLQEHQDALITATLETAGHPISEHPEWDLGV
jgi:glucosamine-6-phosphate deaminase